MVIDSNEKYSYEGDSDKYKHDSHCRHVIRKKNVLQNQCTIITV